MKAGILREARLASTGIILVAAASLIGQLATYPNLAPWYAGLKKPVFVPPNWVFGPVWTTLYLLMAVAVWRVLRRSPQTSGRRLGLALFFVQLALNAVWPWMFFAAHSPLLGLVNIVPQLGIILAMTVTFLRVDRIAGWCLVPLAIWVAFATILNVSIWSLNP